MVDGLVSCLDGLVDLTLPRNPVTVLQEAAWTGLENLLPTPLFNPKTSLDVASRYNYIMKLRESRYTSTLPSALEGHQWLTCSHHINSGKET
jgi:hypothetical protein